MIQSGRAWLGGKTILWVFSKPTCRERVEDGQSLAGEIREVEVQQLLQGPTLLERQGQQGRCGQWGQVERWGLWGQVGW